MSIESPCILICSIEPISGHCYGCGRTRDEIAGWGGMAPDDRRAVMATLPDRVDALPRRERRQTRRRRKREVLEVSSTDLP